MIGGYSVSNGTTAGRWTSICPSACGRHPTSSMSSHKVSVWMLQHHYRWSVILQYLDDFLSIISAKRQCAHDLAAQFGQQFDNLCTELGFEVKHKKSITGTMTDVLGLEIDTIRMEARLQPRKHQKAMFLVSTFLKWKTLSRTESQSIIGFLSFAAKVVPLGHPFINALTTSHHSVRLSSDIKPTYGGGRISSPNGVGLPSYIPHLSHPLSGRMQPGPKVSGVTFC
jgi:hypothetical protein